MEKCNELFLDDIVEIDIHPVAGCVFPIPYSVQGITSMSNCTLSDPVLRIGQGEGMVPAVEGSMTAKCTINRQAQGMLAAIDISANVEEDTEIIRSLYNKIIRKDYYAVLHRRDGRRSLCYTLPNTFSFQSPVNVQGAETRSLSISMKACSEFITMG